MGLSSILDADLIDRLQEECEKVIATEDQVEFWFSFSAADAYIGSCLCLAAFCPSQRPLVPCPSGHPAQTQRPPNQRPDLGSITTV